MEETETAEVVGTASGIARQWVYMNAFIIIIWVKSGAQPSREFKYLQYSRQ